MSNYIDQKVLAEDISLRLPINGLPYSVQEIITTYAKALNCPTEFVTGSAMAAAAQAAGNRFYWSDDLYKCYPQFYAMFAADSTVNKTKSLAKLFEPLERADESDKDKYEQVTAGMKKEEKARTPYKVRVLHDYTLESFQDNLRFNPDGVTAYCDEILTFFGNFDKYRAGADEKFFLSTFGNYSDYKKIRRSEGLIYIPCPIVRVVGGIQPDVLRKYFGGSLMLSDGMLPRFLCYMVPNDFMLDENGQVIRLDRVKAMWEQILNKLLSQVNTIRLVFDNSAQQIYQDYKNSHSKAKNAKTLYGYESSVCGKLEIYAIMWAMITRILRFAATDESVKNSLTICAADIEYSLNCMDYFQNTAMKAYHIITGGMTMPLRDCIRGLKDYIKNQSKFAESIGVSHQYVNKIINAK